jgi:anti-sigma factor RsiW
MNGWLTHRQAAGCRQAGRLLQSYLDGELDEVTARRVAGHLEDCRRCGLEAATYTAIKSALARRGTVPPGAAERLRVFGEDLLTAPETTGGPRRGEAQTLREAGPGRGPPAWCAH